METESIRIWILSKIVFCCIVAWIQPDNSGCQQNFLVVWRWNHFWVHSTTILQIFKRILFYFCKIKLDELEFLSTSILNFAGYTGSKNQVHPTWFLKLNFLKIKYKSKKGEPWENLWNCSRKYPKMIKTNRIVKILRVGYKIRQIFVQTNKIFAKIGLSNSIFSVNNYVNRLNIFFN